MWPESNFFRGLMFGLLICLPLWAIILGVPYFLLWRCLYGL